MAKNTDCVLPRFRGRGRRVNRDLFRVIRLFTGELHSEKGVLENDRTGFLL